MRFLRVVLLLMNIILFGEIAYPQNKNDNWFIPDMAGIQTAGYIGYICGGAGYYFWDKLLEVSLWYGYVPPSIGGTSIHTFATRDLIYPFTWNICNFLEISPYAGATILFALDRDLYWTQSTDVPNEHKFYYPPTGVHAAANAGIQVLFEGPEKSFKHGFYMEVTMLDTYIKAYVWDDRKHLSFSDCASMALGYKVVF